MYDQDVDDATCYCYFPAMLKGSVQKWFNGLSDGSIASFLQLVELFNAYFIVNKREWKTSIHLDKIQQARGEDLKGYMIRFNRAVVLIPDL